GGRLVIVDFAPHAMEFLRETFAHERLGFAGALVEQWLAEAGLLTAPTQNLAPAEPGNEDKLTVTVWTASRPAGAEAPAADAKRNRVEV
ncbi:MAG: ArsR family transcriptional regulator, partial [Proteobacteria bacterium]|nr:ArsR family transcriptional regulator [Pseudomonadota bacterium]